MLLVPADIVFINGGESEFHVWPLLIRMKSLIKKQLKAVFVLLAKVP